MKRKDFGIRGREDVGLAALTMLVSGKALQDLIRSWSVAGIPQRTNSEGGRNLCHHFRFDDLCLAASFSEESGVGCWRLARCLGVGASLLIHSVFLLAESTRGKFTVQ